VIINCAEATTATYDPNGQNAKACSRVPPN
jgi:hypothetical protein